MAAAPRQECCICKDSFKSPKLIPCNHSFCYKCLEDYVRVNLRNGRFNCPLCRTRVALPKEGVSGFESNVHIIDCDHLKTIEQEDTKEISASEKYESEKYACDICGPNSIACFRCLDCGENFCQVCSNVHEKSKATRHHTISDLGTLDQKTKGTIRQRIFCEKHLEEEIKLVCQKCNVLMCVLCKAVNHDTHSSKTVADAAVQVQTILQANITECTVELRRLNVCLQTGAELETRINDAEQQELQAVEHQLLQLYTLFEQEAVTLTDKIKSIYGELRMQNVAFMSGVQNRATLCFTAKENATKLISQGTDIEKVQKGPILQRQIDEAKMTLEPNPPRLEKKIFSPYAGNQSRFGSLLGNVQDSTTVHHNYPRQQINKVFLKMSEEGFQANLAQFLSNSGRYLRHCRTGFTTITIEASLRCEIRYLDGSAYTRKWFSSLILQRIDHTACTSKYSDMMINELEINVVYVCHLYILIEFVSNLRVCSSRDC